MKDVVVVSGVRTAIGSYGQSLKDTSACDMASATVAEAIKRAGITGDDVDHTVFGNVIHSEPRDMYISRVAAVNGGVRESAPALTVNRLCGSGLQAIVTAAQQIQLGQATTVVAGGFTEPLLTRMNLRTGDAEEDETEELTATLVRKAASNRKRGGLHAWWHNVDEQYMKPCFSSEARSGGPSGSLVGLYTSSGGGGGGSGSGMEGSNGGGGYGQGTGMLRGSTGGYGSTTSSQDDDGDLGGGTAQGAALMGQSMTGLGSVGASLPASAAAAAAISGDIGTYQAPEDGDGDLGGAADAL